jgi:V-type H+-transporting ATPase subunit F
MHQQCMSVLFRITLQNGLKAFREPFRTLAEPDADVCFVHIDPTNLMRGYNSFLHLSAMLQIANMIRFLVDSYNKPIPAILEIPSKDHPYDPASDSVLSRVKYLFSSDSSADRR